MYLASVLKYYILVIYKKGYKIYLTGSNAKLLSNEKRDDGSQVRRVFAGVISSL
jgi:hypothetical protein